MEKTQKPNLDLLAPADAHTSEEKLPLRFTWKSEVPELEFEWELQTVKGEAVARVRQESAFSSV